MPTLNNNPPTAFWGKRGICWISKQPHYYVIIYLSSVKTSLSPDLMHFHRLICTFSKTQAWALFRRVYQATAAKPNAPPKNVVGSGVGTGILSLPTFVEAQLTKESWIVPLPNVGATLEVNQRMGDSYPLSRGLDCPQVQDTCVPLKPLSMIGLASTPLPEFSVSTPPNT